MDGNGGTGIASGVPSSGNDVYAIIPAGVQQTEKAQSATAAGEYLIIRSVSASIPEAASPTGTAACDVDLEIKRKGGVWRPIGGQLACSAQQRTVTVEYEPPIVVPPSADYRLVGRASTTDLVVGGVISGVSVKVHGK